MDVSQSHFDVIIIGAGLSGIGAAHHLSRNCPSHSIAILEARANIGGTWDLFKYPGIRSDSDMYTLGYSFRPWIDDNAIADGPAILNYINDTADEYDIRSKIKFNHKVTNASWSSDSNQWTISCSSDDADQMMSYTCDFIFMCSGYYSYESGYMPDFKNINSYDGQVIHPQKWPEGLDYSDKKVVVIGSGATAVTLVPELAKKASHVVMLQRSPSYVMSAPQQDAIANNLRKLLPNKLAYGLSRWKNILMGMLFFNVCRKWPGKMKSLLMKGVKAQLSKDYDVDTHFNPKYNPWDQRLCLVPDNDLFASINSGKSSVVTDHIESFTKNGIQLQSGAELEADIVVSATGLRLQFLGGLHIDIDGQSISTPELYAYRGMMFSGVPNLAAAFGYTNASWTLKCDLTCEYVCRLLKYMERKNYSKCVPVLPDNIEDEPLIDFSSGYVTRAARILPKQGKKRPWRVFQNYILDLFNFKYSSLSDGTLKFG